MLDFEEACPITKCPHSFIILSSHFFLSFWYFVAFVLLAFLLLSYLLSHFTYRSLNLLIHV
ncbi:hypothetical protein KFK09_025428 [Dendrobium nobile]|uniref:Uncharacterized protein n=1 Tax=Dendrobium nobile TaxID=94219 RepID=A0A8T3AGJ4_DENNO|nr:hypothetical protein KFK09_025428 [Dendrobium nobile]